MSAEWRRGVRLGIDVGTVRIGVAKSDPDGLLAIPVTTVARGLVPRPAHRESAAGIEGVPEPDSPADISELRRLVIEHGAVEVIIGLPITLSGRHGTAAAAIREYAEKLAQFIDPIPVRLVDERLSTVVAARRLSERGVRGRRQRAVVDQAAAAEILQGWLDTQRRRT